MEVYKEFQTTAVRCRMQAAFLSHDTVTSDIDADLDWTQTCCVLSPGHIAAATDTLDILSLLCAEGMADFSLAHLPCTTAQLLKPHDDDHQEAFDKVVCHQVKQVVGYGACAVPGGTWQSVRRTAPGRRGVAHSTGNGSRLTDGLDAPQDWDGKARFYATDYRSPVGVLPFCMTLPSNPLGLRFCLESLREMATDAVMKMYEIQRLHRPLKPKQVCRVACPSRLKEGMGAGRSAGRPAVHLRGGGGGGFLLFVVRSALPIASVRPQRPPNRVAPARTGLPTAFPTTSNRLCNPL